MKNFVAAPGPNQHPSRAAAIARAHPEVRALAGPAPASLALILLLVVSQLALAYALRDAPIWLLLAVAYFIGGTINIGLFAMIHEASHGLLSHHRLLNRAGAYLANAATFWPAAESFLRHHRRHHAHLGSYERDPSVPRRWEAQWVGRTPVRKLIWLAAYSVIYPLRFYSLNAGGRFFEPAMLVNFLFQASINTGLALVWGVQAPIYLALSFALSFGAHPLNAMTIQEHSLAVSGQDTYSYYGWANVLTFNAGHHVEHHDFPRIPWIRLPRLRKIAPEFYDALHSYQSWSAVLFDFIFDPRWCLWRRAVR